MHPRPRSAIDSLPQRETSHASHNNASATEKVDPRFRGDPADPSFDRASVPRHTFPSPRGHEQPSRAIVPAVLLTAVLAALILGGLNLGGPSLWHDELIHVFVAKSILETGEARLPSGVPYHNGTTINLLIALALRVLGDSEAALRLPSLIFGALNVLLIYAAVRPLLGRTTALVAACALALSPWTVAWSREARFYSLQQSLYLATAIASWYLIEKRGTRTIVTFAATALSAYALAVLTSFHSGMFIGLPVAHILCLTLYQKKITARQLVLLGACAAAAVTAALVMYGLMNSLDRQAVFERGGLGGTLLDAERSERFYYLNWLRTNLSTGFFILALLGFIAMPFREGRRGLYAALAFWVPLIVLTFLIGYRRPRFMFFAFPFYVAAYSYAGVVLSQWLFKPKKTWLTRAAALCLIVFAARLTLSAVSLIGDSVEAAAGANETLARLHPQWNIACEYVRENRGDAVILTTTYLPVLYYLGRVDNWYPSREIWWERDESGMEGLKDLADLKEYVAQNPKGYFIAHWWRFERNTPMALEVAWVNEHMTRIEEASTKDISVWAWGL